jgi:predicted metal-dependent hydrolase
MFMPWEVIDYVLVHELSHTKHLNHSSSFWQMVEENLPDYKARKKTLKIMQAEVSAFQI